MVTWRSWLTSRVGVTRAELYAFFLVIIISGLVGLHVTDHWNTQAQHAARRAQSVLVEQRLRAEKVCTATNAGQACRDLFQRIVAAADMTERRQFACLVARELHRPDLASKIDCRGILKP